jgi:ectoine hydroxylase-related dioxygenase (phytanoyl-CoA dioxygenase family)
MKAITLEIGDVFKDDAAINFFNCFGYLHLKNFFELREINKMKKSFDCSYKSFFAKSKFKILYNSIVKKQGHLVPNFLDNNPEILKILKNKKLFDLPKQLLGEDAIYWGSDGTLLSHGSHWHRDYATLAKQCKINIYLQSGNFTIIPGSHHVLDQYSQILQQSLYWPNDSPNTPEDTGMNKNNFLPRNNTLKNKLFEECKSLPHTTISFKKGDLIIFDNRLVHCVSFETFPRPRRLIAVIFSDFSSTGYEIPSYNTSVSSQKITSELIQLKNIEIDKFKVDGISKEMKDFFEENSMQMFAKLYKYTKKNKVGKFLGNHQSLNENTEILSKNFK